MGSQYVAMNQMVTPNRPVIFATSTRRQRASGPEVAVGSIIVAYAVQLQSK
jgi:hypothetical protein